MKTELSRLIVLSAVAIIAFPSLLFAMMMPASQRVATLDTSSSITYRVAHETTQTFSWPGENARGHADRTTFLLSAVESPMSEGRTRLRVTLSDHKASVHRGGESVMYDDPATYRLELVIGQQGDVTVLRDEHGMIEFVADAIELARSIPDQGVSDRTEWRETDQLDLSPMVPTGLSVTTNYRWSGQGFTARAEGSREVELHGETGQLTFLANHSARVNRTRDTIEQAEMDTVTKIRFNSGGEFESSTRISITRQN